MTGEQVSRLIEIKGEQIAGKIIADLIKENDENLSAKLTDNWDRYSGKVPINKRKNEDPLKISANMKLPNDYYGDIVDQIQGFVFSESITIQHEDEAQNNIITEFNVNNDFDALKTELSEYVLACGRGSVLHYVESGTGDVKIMNIKPWQVVVVYSDSTEEPQYAMIYYPYEMVNYNTGKVDETTRVEWYDKEKVTYYIKQGGGYVEEKGEVFEAGEIKELVNPQPHQFDRVPVTEFFANARKQSVFEKVKGLIEAYDIGLSDWMNEIVEFKQAYLKAVGAEIDEKERKKARNTRVINMPDKDSNIDFLVKNLSPEFVENFIKIVDTNIYKFSKTLNMADEKVVGGGAQSGESRKWRMLSLIFLGMTIEVFFTKGLRRLYKVSASYWNKFSTKVDPLKITFEFTRKLPSDLLYAAELLNKLWGKLPVTEIYKLLPFIDDPKEIFEQYKEEFAVDLDDRGGQTD